MEGYFALVLHCHLPFVRHPEHEHFLEENWFYEAVAETYLPLIDIADRWIGKFERNRLDALRDLKRKLEGRDDGDDKA